MIDHMNQTFFILGDAEKDQQTRNQLNASAAQGKGNEGREGIQGKRGIWGYQETKVNITITTL